MSAAAPPPRSSDGPDDRFLISANDQMRTSLAVITLLTLALGGRTEGSTSPTEIPGGMTVDLWAT